MAIHGFALFRNQGNEQNESGIKGQYLTAEEQCTLSENFGAGKLHSTHGVHPEAPCRDIFRLSNDPNHGFNSVGPEWHNDGSFCREVFGHVVYHIIEAPEGAGNTQFAHLGTAYDKLPSAAVQARLRRCASVNSNGGAVHPLAHSHPVSGRMSLYLHLGMTGAILETSPTDANPSVPPARDTSSPFGDGSTPSDLPGARKGASADNLSHVKAWRDSEMNTFFTALSEHVDRADVSYSHKWQQGDVIVIDNLAVAHKASPGAHTLKSGLPHHDSVCSPARPAT
uniref:TauD/TfdA-like domain-containing protein n=1 Tax=Pyrodinium bahamense TaxID=73915 RepID=A0A7S0FIK1_9DINO